MVETLCIVTLGGRTAELWDFVNQIVLFFSAKHRKGCNQIVLLSMLSLHRKKSSLSTEEQQDRPDERK